MCVIKTLYMRVMGYADCLQKFTDEVIKHNVAVSAYILLSLLYCTGLAGVFKKSVLKWFYA